MQYPVTAPRLLAYVSARCFLSSRAEDIDGDSGFVCAQADLIKLSGCSIGVFHYVKAVTEIRIGNNLTFAVFAVEKP